MIRSSNNKKRKHDNPLDDIERTLTGSFKTAANNVAALYTQSVAQQRKAYALGARDLAERMVQWLETEFGGTQQQISPHQLVAFLKRELEDIEGSAAEHFAPNVVPVPQGDSLRTMMSASSPYDQRMPGSRSNGRAGSSPNPRARSTSVSRNCENAFGVEQQANKSFGAFNIEQQEAQQHGGFVHRSASELMQPSPGPMCASQPPYSPME